MYIGAMMRAEFVVLGDDGCYTISISDILPTSEAFKVWNFLIICKH